MGYEGLTTEPNPAGGGEYTLERLVWPSGREINGYPFTTFTDFFRLSRDDTESLVRRSCLLCRFSLVDIVETIETSPDKKMRVGSLQSPREYDGRLPLDVDSYLNLVIPRKEESPKKIGSQVRLLHGRILQIQ